MRKVVRLLCLVAAICTLAANSNAQPTLNFLGVGSSALFLELGQASISLNGGQGGITAATLCTYTTKSTANVIMNDQGAVLTNEGNFWIVWTAGGGTCAVPGATSIVQAYLQVDSVVGDRCVFRTGAAGTTCILQLTLPLPAPANLLSGTVFTTADQVPPAAVTTALNGIAFGVAGTDIRPEDAKFATIRALGARGVAIGGSQYLGLGLKDAAKACRTIPIEPGTIPTAQGATAVQGADFSLPGAGATDPCTSAAAVTSFNVIPVGASPIVVFVNTTDTSTKGFGDELVNDVTRAQLAGFLDGTYCRPVDMIREPFTAPASTVFSTTFVREPLSGTYNTMEYSIPNNVEIQSSQDLGKVGGVAWTAPGANYPGNATCKAQPSGTNRQRATSTGTLVASVLATTNGLGYAFWSTGNFKAATETGARYLTVDGLDPILADYGTNGVIPTPSNFLLDEVTFTWVKEGKYPIWSILRLVTTSNTPAAEVTAAQNLAAAAQNLISPQQPDFALISQIEVFHSHFIPPTVNTTASNGAAPTVCTTAEAGGDVGGLTLTKISDGDYCTDFAVTTGHIGLRQ